MNANTLFLICALSLPVTSVNHPNGQTDSRDEFVREYKWIHNLLERSYPGHEFLIVPTDLNITPTGGWEKITTLQWRSHILYKRPLKKAA